MDEPLSRFQAPAGLGQDATLEEFWPLFEARCEAKGLANATLSDYRKQWRLRIRPAFGDARVADVRFSHVQAWLYGMTPNTAHHAARTLKRMLSVAVDLEVIPSNPLMGRRLDFPVARSAPGVDGPPSMPWGAREVSLCMERLRGERVEPLWLVLAGGGLRTEEGLALWWEDVGFRYVAGSLVADIAVWKAWTEADGLKRTKNASSTRVVPIPAPFSERLAELARQGPRVRLWDAYGRYASREWRRLFLPGARLSALPYAPLSSMRSVHETLMQEAGVLDTVNARIHGRTNVQTGYAHYLRPSVALDEAAITMGILVNMQRDGFNSYEKTLGVQKSLPPK